MTDKSGNADIEPPAGCICQDQHRRGYCTEPGCPYSDPEIMKARDEAARATDPLKQPQYIIEGIILRRLHQKRIEGYTIETAKEIAEALSDVAQAVPVPALVEFFKWAMREGPWDGGDLDGGSVQDKAESLGLIVKTQYDAEKHGVQSDFEHGDDWFVLAPGIALPSTDRATPDVPGVSAPARRLPE
jgi:hypothetical protein